MRQRLLSAIAVASIVVSGVALLWRTGMMAPAAVQNAKNAWVPLKDVLEPLDDIPLQGSGTASVVLIEYADFRCGYCGEFSKSVLPGLRSDYVHSGKLVLGFRTWVIGGLSDPLGLGAAVTAECAAAQGRFWDMHDALFATPGNLDRAGAVSMSRRLRLDADRVEECLNSASTRRIAETAERAKALGFQGTPSFILGRRTGRVMHAVYSLTGVPQRKDLDAVLATLLRHESS